MEETSGAHKKAGSVLGVSEVGGKFIFKICISLFEYVGP